jgi:large conductance mechanosensitive channel
MLSEFRRFILRGNVIDLAIAVVIGIAFGAIIKSFVDDIIMPPIGIIAGNVDFADLFIVLQQGAPPGPYATLAEAKDAGAVTLRYGLFINTVIYFLIVAVAMFLLIKIVTNLIPKEEAAPTTKNCPYCLMQIPLQATRCPHCTSEVRA